ncbi:hypothetical protein MHYP_G00329720 [Metynnis hypsauchen]
MAPVCVAGRLFLLVWLVLLSFGTSHIKSLLVYDRQFLLDLRHSVSDLAVFNHDGQNTLPPLLSGIPTHLYRAWASTSQRKRRRRRGKRSGRLVKLKVCLARSSSISRTGHGLSPPFVVSRRFLEPIDTCLVRVVGLDEGVRPRRPCSPRPRQRGVDPRNLRTLLRAPRSAEPQAPAPARIGLVNARSLANKTFILRDFFSSRSLDLLCVTETWIGAGDHSALVELLPAGCSYFNSPRTSGRGGGTATVFKNDFKCKQRALTTSISSFEVTLFEVGRSDPVLCAVIYRPPKYNKDFINDFSEFLAGLMPNYDRVLIVGDFNIHVCCPEKPLVTDFLNIIDSFNFVQCVFGPTHEHGHTLDLVLSHGLSVLNIEICDSGFSDHMPVLVDVVLSSAAVKSCAPARLCRRFNPFTAGLFSAAFDQLCPPPDSASVDTEKLSSWFYSSCRNILDSVAPLRSIQPKVKPEPWFNDRARAAKRECRKAERRWKKDKLQVSFQILKDSWRSYQNTIKETKREHLSNIIMENRHNPRVLFKTIDSVLKAPQPICLEASPEMCNNFLHFFIDKIVTARALTTVPASDPSYSASCLAEFDRFEPVTLSYLEDVVGHIKPSGSLCDVMPPHFFKEVFQSIGQQVLAIINSSLSSGIVPAVSHPSTNQARPCLASEIRRDRAFSEWYGRKRERSRG